MNLCNVPLRNTVCHLNSLELPLKLSKTSGLRVASVFRYDITESYNQVL